MKVHLLLGERLACHQNLPEAGLLSINPGIVTCLRCRATKYFKAVSDAKKRKGKKAKNNIQMELFGR